jgi:hypothetical protein
MLGAISRTIMKTKFWYGLIIVIIAFYNCSPKAIPTYKCLPVVDLCDLPKYENKKVLLKSIYSGVEEYWSLGSLKDKECTKDLQVELEFVDNYEMPSEFQQAMRSVTNNYWNSYLIIEAIGSYETGDAGGYGHLGTNKSQFLVKKIISAKIMRKE